jgi:hypothetical protein
VLEKFAIGCWKRLFQKPVEGGHHRADDRPRAEARFGDERALEAPSSLLCGLCDLLTMRRAERVRIDRTQIEQDHVRPARDDRVPLLVERRDVARGIAPRRRLGDHERKAIVPEESHPQFVARPGGPRTARGARRHDAWTRLTGW